MYISTVFVPAFIYAAAALPALNARQSPGWSILGLNRTCVTTPSPVCALDFNIATNDGAPPIQCHLTPAGPDTQSFAALTCPVNADWEVSWGYNSAGWAVMTTVKGTQDAFFGFNNVNSMTNFPDNGPNQVYTCPGHC